MNLCFNGGICYFIEIFYVCICVLGYSGDQCEFDFDECYFNFCCNGVICVDGFNIFRCFCFLSYVGVFCE